MSALCAADCRDRGRQPFENEQRLLLAARVDVALEAPWLSLRVQTPRATDQNEIAYTLALPQPSLNHRQPIAQGFCGLAEQSLAGR